jgi:hypothetical protein
MIPDSESQLVGNTVDRILAMHGEDFDVFAIPQPHQIGLLVNQAHARITNGGFQYLLEREDADYALCKLMAEAHAMIGAEKGSRAFSVFLRGFLGIRPTSLLARPFNRFRLPISIVMALLGFETADTLYFDSADEIYSKLASYIASNPRAFPTIQSR